MRRRIMASEIDKARARRRGGDWRRWLPVLVLVAAIAGFFALGLGRYLTWDAFREHRQALL
jgi:hypothetical protein